MSNLHLFDFLVIGAYFAILLWIGVWAARREKKLSSDYFLAGRDVGWLAVGASLFASNIGSEHLVGLAGTGAASGLAVGHFEWIACFMLLLLGWLFVPFYLRSGVYTMPEFLERRYNSAARWYFTWVSVIGYVLTKISVTLIFVRTYPTMDTHVKYERAWGLYLRSRNSGMVYTPLRR